jgi:hypothetical protein
MADFNDILKQLKANQETEQQSADALENLKDRVTNGLKGVQGVVRIRLTRVADALQITNDTLALIAEQLGASTELQKAQAEANKRAADEAERNREKLEQQKGKPTATAPSQGEEEQGGGGGLALAGFGGALGLGAGAGAGVGLAALGIGGGVAVGTMGIAKAIEIFVEAMEKVPKVLEDFSNAFLKIGEDGENINMEGVRKFGEAFNIINDSVGVLDAIALVITRFVDADSLTQLALTIDEIGKIGQNVDQEGIDKFGKGLKSFNESLTAGFVAKGILSNFIGVDDLKDVVDVIKKAEEVGSEFEDTTGFTRFADALTKFDQAFSGNFVAKGIFTNFIDVETINEIVDVMNKVDTVGDGFEDTVGFTRFSNALSALNTALTAGFVVKGIALNATDFETIETLADHMVGIGEKGKSIDLDGIAQAGQAIKDIDDAFGIKFVAEAILLNFVKDNTFTKVAKQLGEFEGLDGPKLSEASKGIVAVADAIDKLGGGFIDTVMEFFTGGPFDKFVELADAGDGMKAFAEGFEHFGRAIANFQDDNLETIKTNIKTFIRQTRSEFASLERVLNDFDEDDVEKLKLLQGVNFNTNAQGALMSFNNQANQGADVVQPVVVSSNTVVNQGDTTAVSGSTAVAVTPSVSNGDSSSKSFGETEF